MVKRFLILQLLMITSILYSQQQTKGTISGFVYDNQSGEALIGANVFLQDTYFGSSTNVSGYYSLPKVPVGNYTLLCQYIGYKTFSTSIKITSNMDKQFNIRMDPATIETEEVFVYADSVRTSVRLYRKSISKIQLKPREIERIPQVVEADLLRSLQTMPGIMPVSDYSSELYVRGGTPDQNLYLIDGADVYNPEHFFGLFSTFNTDAIKNVDISKGGFGAEYGGRLSSVLDVTNLDGNRREYQGKVAISLLSAKTTMQYPLGKYGAISGSFRRTYFDQTLAKAIDDIPDYYFYDGHLKAFIDIDNRNKLTISFYKGQDNLDFQLNNATTEEEELDYDWGNTTYSIRWTHIFSSSLFGNFWTTFSDFDSDFSFEEFMEENDMGDRSLKGNLEYYYSQNLNLKLGFEYKSIHGTFRQKFPGGRVEVDRWGKYIASYIQSEWNPMPLLEIQTGLRYNYFDSNKSFQNLAPRLSVKYRLTDTINLKSAFGIYHQYLFRIPRTFIADIWTSSDEFYGNSTSHHYIMGFQKEISDNFELEIETYYKDYSNLYSYDYFFYTGLKPKNYTDNGEPIYQSTQGLFNRGNGHSYGLEFLLRKNSGPITGWASYTLSRAIQKIEGVNQSENFVPRHDRTHTLNLIGNIDIKNSLRQLRGVDYHRDKTTWRLGFGVVYASGQPITTTSSIYVTNPLPDQYFYSGYNLYPTERNNFRLPPYFRFDLSLTMEKRYKSWTLAPYLQIFNVTNRKNVWFIDYDDEIQGNKLIQKVDTFSMFPILPTIGVTMTF